MERRYRFCPWCAAPQRVKIVDVFCAHPGIEQDRGKVLRVSRCLDERHTPFSVWDESGDPARATAAVSLDDEEAGRLARFLEDTPPTLSSIPAPADSTTH